MNIKKIGALLLIGVLLLSFFSFIACDDNPANTRITQEENDPNNSNDKERN